MKRLLIAIFILGAAVSASQTEIESNSALRPIQNIIDRCNNAIRNYDSIPGYEANGVVYVTAQQAKESLEKDLKSAYIVMEIAKHRYNGQKSLLQFLQEERDEQQDLLSNPEKAQEFVQNGIVLVTKEQVLGRARQDLSSISIVIALIGR